MAGDSKTDATWPNSWPSDLDAAVNVEEETGWTHFNIGISGATVASFLAVIDDKIAEIDDPENTKKILINFGVNDQASIDFDNAGEVAVWVSDYESLIDQLATVCPNADFYLSRPWARIGTEWNQIAAAIGTIVSDRPLIAHLGDDERVWLEGGDDGATMTTDGTHYSAAGQAEKTAQMMTVLGY